MDWKVIAASARGTAHINSGTPCQDAYYYRQQNGMLVALVCDGAGSAMSSEFGATHGAKTICEEILLQISANGNQLDRDELVFWIKNAIKTARKTLPGVMSDQDMRHYHATMVGVFISEDFALFFHIGDGAAVAIRQQEWENAVVISAPENGPYAEFTYFYTLPNWYEHFRVTDIPLDTDVVVLMTDGSMGFVMNRQRTGLDARFMTPVDRYLQSADSQTGQHALLNTLQRPETCKITTDDKTVLWARRTV